MTDPNQAAEAGTSTFFPELSASERRTSYLGLKHGAAVHRVGRRSPLPLLSFALNFCNENIEVSELEAAAAECGRSLEERSLTFQVVVCYEA